MTPDTHWSLLIKATLDGTPDGQSALEELCRRYRTPVERYIAGRISDQSRLDDLAQSFFLRFLRLRLWKRADESKGRFRNYLFAAVRNFLIEEHRHVSAGGEPDQSWEELSEAGREPVINPEPGRHFDHEWAQQLLRLASRRLRMASREDGESSRILEQFLFGESAAPGYSEAARTLGISEAALRQRVSRTRQQLGLLFRAEVARTVEPHEVDGELHYLIGLLVTPPPAAW